MTCAKVAINGPNLKKLAQKKNQIGESGGERKKNPSANPDSVFQISDILERDYAGKGYATQFVTLQKALYITTFICVLGGGFFLATALFIEKDKLAAQKQIHGKYEPDHEKTCLWEFTTM